MELSYENSERLIVLNYFREKSSIVDLRLRSKYTSEMEFFRVNRYSIANLLN